MKEENTTYVKCPLFFNHLEIVTHFIKLSFQAQQFYCHWK